MLITPKASSSCWPPSRRGTTEDPDLVVRSELSIRCCISGVTPASLSPTSGSFHLRHRPAGTPHSPSDCFSFGGIACRVYVRRAEAGLKRPRRSWVQRKGPEGCVHTCAKLMDWPSSLLTHTGWRLCIPGCFHLRVPAPQPRPWQQQGLHF